MNSERDKKYVTRNIIVNKTVHKEVKRQKQKQEIENTESRLGLKDVVKIILSSDFRLVLFR